MRMVIYDDEGHETYNGEFDDTRNIPCHGSFSLEISPGQWISMLGTEYINIRIHQFPINWANK